MQNDCKFTNGIIAMIDHLGTSDIQEKDIEAYEKDVEMFDLLSRTIGSPDYCFEYGNYPIESEYRFSSFMFSDTIIVTYLTDKTEKYLGLMAHQLMRLICNAISKSRFYRGVLNIGELYVSEDKPIVLGSAIEEASKLYEQTNWFGVSLCPTASAFLDNSKNDNLKRLFADYQNIPWKKPTKSHWALNWPLFLQNEYQSNLDLTITRPDPKEILENIEVESDESIKEKYQNSIQFYQYVKEQ